MSFGDFTVRTPKKEQLRKFLATIKSVSDSVGKPKIGEKFLDLMAVDIAKGIDLCSDLGADPTVYLVASYGLSCLRDELAKVSAAPSN